jgi:hypothetical protein
MATWPWGDESFLVYDGAGTLLESSQFTHR